MSRGFVLRAVLGVLFAAASFAAAIILHPGDRALAGHDVAQAQSGIAR